MELEILIRELRKARDANDLSAVRDIVELAIRSKPLAGGEPYETAVLHREPDLFVLQNVLPPRESVIPHEHGSWSVSGVYFGQEDNGLYKRIPGARRVELARGLSLAPGRAAILGHEAVHSLRNPRLEHTVALHVYGADLLSLELSKWDPPGLAEARFRFNEEGQMVEVR